MNSDAAPGRAEAFAAFGGVHVLVDDDPRWRRDPVEQARAACAGGPQVVQLRVKRATDREALVWAREIAAIARDHGALFVVNDRFDVALAAEADAVHLGQADLPPASVPAWVRERIAIGRSTHTSEQVEAALREPIGYLAFGPVYGTASKRSDYDDRGLERLAEACDRAAPRPLVAIGGIDTGNAGAVVRAGAAGVAVISAVAAARSPGDAVKRLVETVREAGVEEA